jgi:cysteine desulfurase
MTGNFVYLDYNATTPVDRRVAAVMAPYVEGCYGNPSSIHRLGREARAAVDRARGQVAACLGCAADEVVFTSGGSESNNLAIQGVVNRAGGGHVVTSAIEHPAVLEVVRALERQGRIELDVVGVDRWGRVDPAAIARALRPDTVLVSLMLANNEVGTVEPVAEVAAVCRKRGALLHTDAAQAVGKIPVDVTALGVDLLTVAGHKLYAPKGVGALFIRRGVELEPLIRGAGHEGGLRAGTENVLGQVGLGAACDLVRRELDGETDNLRYLRDGLESELLDRWPGARVHGHHEHRLPNTSSIALPGIDAGLLLERVADEVAASAGAACHSGGVRVSHVLAAMGVDDELARGTLRLSVGRCTTDHEIERGLSCLVEAAREIAS